MNKYSHSVIVVNQDDLSKLQAFMLENEINYEIVDSDSDYSYKALLDEVQYESSDADWDNSGCEY